MACHCDVSTLMTGETVSTSSLGPIHPSINQTKNDITLQNRRRRESTQAQSLQSHSCPEALHPRRKCSLCR